MIPEMWGSKFALSHCFSCWLIQELVW